jgi:hypothetical protein
MTNRQIVEQCLKMAGASTPVEKQVNGITYHTGRWGYVLGGQGELYTKELAEKWARARRCGKPADYFLKDAKGWYTPPRKVADCSGMLVQAFRAFKHDYYDRSANTFRAQFTKAGDIRGIPEIAGVAVWKNGHIGIYLGDGKVVESRGVAHGVVISELGTQKWTHYGYLRDVQYEESPKDTPVFTRMLRYIPGNMQRGDDVKCLQTLLSGKGHSCGSIDGVFGQKTETAVREFQAEYKLVVDGIAGPHTITALGGIFKEDN